MVERMFANKANRYGKLSKTLAVALGAFVLMTPGVAAQGALMDVGGSARATGEAALDAEGATRIVDQVAGEVENAAATANGALEAELDATLDAAVEAPVKAEGAAGASMGFITTVKGYMDGVLQKFKGFFMKAGEESRAEAEAHAELATDAAVASGDALVSEAQGQLAATQYAAASAEYEAHAQVDAGVQDAFSTSEEVYAELEGALSTAETVAYEAQHAADFQYDAHVGVHASSGATGAIQPPKVPQPPAPSGWVGLTSSLQAALTGLVQLGDFSF